MKLWPWALVVALYALLWLLYLAAERRECLQQDKARWSAGDGCELYRGGRWVPEHRQIYDQPR